MDSEKYLIMCVNLHRRKDRAAYFGVLSDLPSAAALKARVDQLTPINIKTKIVRMNPVALLACPTVGVGARILHGVEA